MGYVSVTESRPLHGRTRHVGKYTHQPISSSRKNGSSSAVCGQMSPRPLAAMTNGLLGSGVGSRTSAASAVGTTAAVAVAAAAASTSAVRAIATRLKIACWRASTHARIRASLRASPRVCVWRAPRPPARLPACSPPPPAPPPNRTPPPCPPHTSVPLPLPALFPFAQRPKQPCGRAAAALSPPPAPAVLRAAAVATAARREGRGRSAPGDAATLPGEPSLRRCLSVRVTCLGF